MGGLASPDRLADARVLWRTHMRVVASGLRVLHLEWAVSPSRQRRPAVADVRTAVRPLTDDMHCTVTHVCISAPTELAFTTLPRGHVVTLRVAWDDDTPSVGRQGSGGHPRALQGPRLVSDLTLGSALPKGTSRVVYTKRAHPTPLQATLPLLIPLPPPTFSMMATEEAGDRRATFIQLFAKTTDRDLLSIFIEAGGWQVINKWLTETTDGVLLVKLLQLLRSLPLTLEIIQVRTCPPSPSLPPGCP